MTVDTPVRLQRYFVSLALLWTAIILASVVWNFSEHQRDSREFARLEARSTFDKDLPKIKCRSQQIQQVIMNLLTNALDAVR